MMRKRRKQGGYAWLAMDWRCGYSAPASRPSAPRSRGVPTSPAAGEGGFWEFTKEILSNIFNSRGLDGDLEQAAVRRRRLRRHERDRLRRDGPAHRLLPAGRFAARDGGADRLQSRSGWNVWLLIVTLCVSAIVGDSVGYSIGFKRGPKIFNRENSLFFHKDHLLKAQQFYEKHGGKTIILARFMPIIRTFAPVVAGVGRWTTALLHLQHRRRHRLGLQHGADRLLSAEPAQPAA